MKITNAELKVIRFASEDVIATSGWFDGPLTGKTNGFFNINTGDGYYQFGGTVGQYNGSVYQINGISNYHSIPASDIAPLTAGPNGTEGNGMSYFSDVGVTLPASILTNSAQNGYEATYSNGTYYTDGLSYYENYWQ